MGNFCNITKDIESIKSWSIDKNYQIYNFINDNRFGKVYLLQNNLTSKIIFKKEIITKNIELTEDFIILVKILKKYDYILDYEFKKLKNNNYCVNVFSKFSSKNLKKYYKFLHLDCITIIDFLYQVLNKLNLIERENISYYLDINYIYYKKIKNTDKFDFNLYFLDFDLDFQNKISSIIIKKNEKVILSPYIIENYKSNIINDFKIIWRNNSFLLGIFIVKMLLKNEYTNFYTYNKDNKLIFNGLIFNNNLKKVKNLIINKNKLLFLILLEWVNTNENTRKTPQELLKLIPDYVLIKNKLYKNK